MLNFKNWLNESMDVHIQGHSVDDFPKDLLGITSYLLKHLNKVKINVGFGNLEPDHESDAFGKSGILNYDHPTPNGISAIKYFLDEIGIKYGPFQEQEGYIQIPILNIPEKRSDDPPEMNMSNTSARIVFGDMLGYPGEEGGYFNIPVRDLLMKIDNLSDEQVGVHTQDPYSKIGKGGATHVMSGFDSNRLMRYMDTLRQIAKWAISHHYDTLYVA